MYSVYRKEIPWWLFLVNYVRSNSCLGSLNKYSPKAGVLTLYACFSPPLSAMFSPWVFFPSIYKNKYHTVYMYFFNTYENQIKLPKRIQRNMKNKFIQFTRNNKAGKDNSYQNYNLIPSLTYIQSKAKTVNIFPE